MFLIIIFLDPWVWHLNISSVLQLWMTPQNHHQWKIFLIFSKLEFCFYIWLIIIIFTFGDLVGRFSPQIIIINLFKKKYFFYWLFKLSILSGAIFANFFLLLYWHTQNTECDKWFYIYSLNYFFWEGGIFISIILQKLCQIQDFLLEYS